jgi:hypothetical protein
MPNCGELRVKRSIKHKEEQSDSNPEDLREGTFKAILKGCL